MEDKDAYCRLRHGLNLHCLAKIFEYLDSVDLYTVGGMNKVYMQIINDLVIPKHEINFHQLLLRRGATCSNVLRRYGKNVQKILLQLEYFHRQSDPFLPFIQYCSTDQLRSAKIVSRGVREMNLPIQFRKVENLEIEGREEQLFCIVTAQHSASLRHLRLSLIHLDPNFDWIELKNLTEISLKEVHGINVEKFIEFLGQQRPCIEIFHHDGITFGDSTQKVCDAMAKYCGYQIRNYSGEMPRIDIEVERAIASNLYDFLSGFKNVKQVCLTTHQVCSGDLIDAMKRLAENNTIETLHLNYSKRDMENYLENRPDVDCIFQQKPELNGIDMMHFTHLKTIKVSGYLSEDEYSCFYHGLLCHYFNILNVYGSQILSNVECVTIGNDVHNGDCLIYAQKLRCLNICGRISYGKAANIIRTVNNILQNRNDGEIEGDFIEIITHEYNKSNFEKMVSESMKLSFDSNLLQLKESAIIAI